MIIIVILIAIIAMIVLVLELIAMIVLVLELPLTLLFKVNYANVHIYYPPSAAYQSHIFVQ